jgi:hypothetical protein
MSNDRPETWKPLPKWEARFEVSDKGRVRVRGGARVALWDDGKYLRVKIGRTPRHVHRLVLETFAGACPPGMESLHGPAGRLVNWWPENLRWGTHAENEADKWRDRAR